jgi:hypothetical protein
MKYNKTNTNIAIVTTITLQIIALIIINCIAK